MEELNQSVEMIGLTSMEAYYWWCIAFMILIHAGFMSYEVGVSRVKNVLASAMKNLMTLAVVIPSFYIVGWWIYNAFPDGFIPRTDELAMAALPWSANMGPNIADHESGIFWGAFALFAATTASILSGSVIERIRMSAFVILAALLGSVVWILAGAWGWHGEGWFLTQFGYHDVGAAGVVHAIAGFFALGVLMNLGPRLGKYAAKGKPLKLSPHNLPASMLGLMLIFVGFFGFLGGCIIVISGENWITIYGTPTNLSAFAFNALMGLSGGIIGSYIATKGEPFWVASGGLAGVISVASGLDLFHPMLAFVIAVIGGFIAPYIGSFLERKNIDDAVGAVSVHGFVGIWSILATGIFASGYPNLNGPDISLAGQAICAVVVMALGFIPGYGVSYMMKKMNMLRIPYEAERMGLDLTEVPAVAYPEGIPSTPEKEDFVSKSSSDKIG
ncbi:ammonium transporter [Alteribacillus sp. YIM 98480]|uniref:ammonium transporter n=1 Tax=Alteribacillus sp. YIM 98480 TaxID=2606599 RepID=UPI00131DDB80|nr:ammonium transporter [Alteribacillus sp. YIM 98480]